MSKALLHQSEPGFEVLLVPGGMIVYRSWSKTMSHFATATFVPIDSERVTSGLVAKWLNEFEEDPE